MIRDDNIGGGYSHWLTCDSTYGFFLRSILWILIQTQNSPSTQRFSTSKHSVASETIFPFPESTSRLAVWKVTTGKVVTVAPRYYR